MLVSLSGPTVKLRLDDVYFIRSRVSSLVGRGPKIRELGEG